MPRTPPDSAINPVLDALVASGVIVRYTVEHRVTQKGTARRRWHLRFPNGERREYELRQLEAFVSGLTITKGEGQ